MKHSAHVVILGAGPAGLAAAWDLVDEGFDVILVEAREAPGGLCRTHERQGFFFDQGGHRFITRNRVLYDRVRGLLGSELAVRERSSVIHIGGREYRYPLEWREVVRGEGISGVTRVIASFLFSRARHMGASWLAVSPTADESLERWVRRRFGGALFERFFRGYTRKLWGMEARELSGDWAGQRIAQIGLVDVIRHALRRGRTPRTFATKYCYPRHGIGQIFSALAETVTQKGARIHLSSRVTRIEPDSRLRVEFASPEGPRAVLCDQVVSTIPLPDLVEVLNAPEAVRSRARQLCFRSLRFVNLLLEGPSPSEKTWIYVPDESRLMTRVQFPRNRSPQNCPTGKSSVQLEIPCEYGDAVWNSPEDALVDRCLSDLTRLDLNVRGRVIGSFATRARHAYPVYRRGYKEARDQLIDWVQRIRGVQTVGRQGRFDYIFFDRAMEQGLQAAARIAGRAEREESTEDLLLLPEEARSIVGDEETGLAP